MERFNALFALILLLTSAPPVEADEAKNERDPFNGFRKGSWVVLSTTFSSGGETKTSRIKITRIDDKTDGGIQTLRQKEGKKKGEFDGEKGTSWHVPGFDCSQQKEWKLAEMTNKDLMIEGKKYPCVVKKYEVKKKDETAAITYWSFKQAAIPYRESHTFRDHAMRPDVLKIEIEHQGKDEYEKGWIQVVKFRDDRMVGGRKIVCVKEEGEFDVKDAGKEGKAKLARWLSNEVPGREVSLVVVGEVDGKKVENRTEVESFEVSKGK